MAESEAIEVVIRAESEDNHTDLTKTKEVVEETKEKKEEAWPDLLDSLKTFSKENSLNPNKEQILNESAPAVSAEKEEGEEEVEPKEVVEEEEEEYIEHADLEDQEHTTE